MKVRWQYLVLGALLLWALTAQLSFSVISVVSYLRQSGNVAFPFSHRDSSTILNRIPEEYSETGIRPGDDLLALNHQPVTGLTMLEQMHMHPGDMLLVKVARDVNGKRKEMEMPVRLQQLHSDNLSWAKLLGLRVVLPISCLLVGFYIAFARPDDPLAWITMAMLASFGHIAEGGGEGSWALPSPLRELLVFYNAIVSNSWPVWLLCFALYFPQPFSWTKPREWLIRFSGIVAAFLASLDIYSNFALGSHIRENAWLSNFYAAAYLPRILLYTFYISLFFFLLAWKRRLLTNSDAQRRMRFMINGCTLALLPLLPVALAEADLLPPLPEWLQTCFLLMLLVFPATMAYVIVVQRAMDVRMVIRTGVRYAIASKSLRVIQILLVATLAVLTFQYVHQSGRRVDAVLVAAIGIGLIFLSRRVEMQAVNWMDRRFFREAYNAELLLTELSNSVATLRDMRLLVETVASRIATSLHVDRIAVLLGPGNQFQPVYALGFEGSAPPPFAPGHETLRLVSETNAPVRVYFDDPHSWVHGTSAPDQHTLQQLGAQLLLPVTRKQRLLGLISLGPKRSEEPYSREDLQLLNALASQTGLALENAQLTEDIRRQVVERERLNRELEIAREVQQRLFPQSLPSVPGLDFAGYCRPALEVGGDYYDFLKLRNGCLGVAVGDVSGKGIAAALMMASLQASLRGQTLTHNASLAEMISNVNSLMYDASAANRYATFFYAEYNPITYQLRYVNAGHNPPFIYRRLPDGDQVLRLEEGGTVVGLFPSFPYIEGTLALAPGDLVIAFTDGISEAMDADDGEYGEDRLIAEVRNCKNEDAANLIQCLLAKVDAFTGSAPQNDDMTLVAMRIGKPVAITTAT